MRKWLTALVLVCTPLGGSLVTMIYDGSPSRVEEVLDYRWCQDGDHRSLWEHRYWRIDGASKPVEEQERLLWQNLSPPNDGPQYGG